MVYHFVCYFKGRQDIAILNFEALYNSIADRYFKFRYPSLIFKSDKIYLRHGFKLP